MKRSKGEVNRLANVELQTVPGQTRWDSLAGAETIKLQSLQPKKLLKKKR
jgi:hypothetical protein